MDLINQPVQMDWNQLSLPLDGNFNSTLAAATAKKLMPRVIFLTATDFQNYIAPNFTEGEDFSIAEKYSLTQREGYSQISAYTRLLFLQCLRSGTQAVRDSGVPVIFICYEETWWCESQVVVQLLGSDNGDPALNADTSALSIGGLGVFSDIDFSKFRLPTDFSVIRTGLSGDSTSNFSPKEETVLASKLQSNWPLVVTPLIPEMTSVEMTDPLTSVNTSLLYQLMNGVVNVAGFAASSLKTAATLMICEDKNGFGYPACPIQPQPLISGMTTSAYTKSGLEPGIAADIITNKGYWLISGNASAKLVGVSHAIVIQAGSATAANSCNYDPFNDVFYVRGNANNLFAGISTAEGNTLDKVLMMYGWDLTGVSLIRSKVNVSKPTEQSVYFSHIKLMLQ